MNDYSWPTGTPGPLTGLVAGGVTVAVLGTALGLGALGLSWAWVVYPLGFGGLLPFALAAAARYENHGRSDHRTVPDASATRGEETALEALGRRYARGEIDEPEFERRVERLLRTETVADAREYLESNR